MTERGNDVVDWGASSGLQKGNTIKTGIFAFLAKLQCEC